jgi:hypothetical protein
MNKIVASVGLVALGASGLQPVFAQQAQASPDTTKPWSIAATLRGFYDDNINSSPNRQSAFGYQASPSGIVSLSTDQTTFNAGATYSATYYDHTPFNSSDRWDNAFTLNGGLTHNFNEEYQASVTESFVLGQEPDMLRAGNTFSEFNRVSGDNIRNSGAITVDGKLTRLLGFEVGYDNAYYDYAAISAPTDIAGPGQIRTGPGATLNRIENGVHLEGRYELAPETYGIVGFRYREIGYTAGVPITGTSVVGAPDTFSVLVNSDARNADMYAPYVGISHVFSPSLNASLDVGANYAEYPNDSSQAANWSPYVSLSGQYHYTPQSYIEVGFTQDRSPSSVTGFNPNGANSGFANLTVDQETSTLFASINHQITSRLVASAMAQYQAGVFNGGSFDNNSQTYYLVGVNLDYTITQNLSAHIGYNYDKLDSSVGSQSFDRNRVYMGVTASY